MSKATCPICGDESIVVDGIISCANLQCGSNGGENFSELFKSKTLDGTMTGDFFESLIRGSLKEFETRLDLSKESLREIENRIISQIVINRDEVLKFTTMAENHINSAVDSLGANWQNVLTRGKSLLNLSIKKANAGVDRATDFVNEARVDNNEALLNQVIRIIDANENSPEKSLIAEIQEQTRLPEKWAKVIYYKAKTEIMKR